MSRCEVTGTSNPMRRGGAKSFVDDLGWSRGVVLSRAATLLRSIETQPCDSKICSHLDEHTSLSVAGVFGTCAFFFVFLSQLVAEGVLLNLFAPWTYVSSILTAGNDSSLTLVQSGQIRLLAPRPRCTFKRQL